MQVNRFFSASLITVLGAFVLTPSARAQPSSDAAAQTLFDQAVDEMAAGSYASACPKLEEATRLAPEAGGAKEQLAECYEATGRLASAWSQWSVVEGISAKQNNQERLHKAQERMAALKPRLATLTIDVPTEISHTKGLTISRDDRAVGTAEWGVPIPVDRGPHVVTARAADGSTSEVRVEVASDGITVKATLPPLAKAPSGPTLPKRIPQQMAGIREDQWQMPLGVTGIAVGGAGIVLGAIFGGLAIAENNASHEEAGGCDDASNFCTDAGLERRDRALTYSYVSTAGIIIGAAVATAGIVVLATKPSDQSDVRVTLRLIPQGLSISGRF